MSDDSPFGQPEYRNTALRFAEATRVQLDRWEPLVADYISGDREPGLVWRARNEHHLCVVVAAQLVMTADMLRPALTGTPDLVRLEIREARDLLEHWPENQRIFNSQPRPAEPPRRSGRRYAERNPRGGPYSALRWNSKQGPLLTHGVPASEIRALIKRVEARVVGENPALAEFLTTSPRSPWVSYDGQDWWPRGGLA